MKKIIIAAIAAVEIMCVLLLPGCGAPASGTTNAGQSYTVTASQKKAATPSPTPIPTLPPTPAITPHNVDMSPRGASAPTYVASRPTPTPMPTTSQGTPINSDFRWADIDMFSTPESTCFSEIGYNAESEVLVVTFRDSGASYAYYDLPESVWDALCGANSKGRFYNSDIKGAYYCEKLG